MLGTQVEVSIVRREHSLWDITSSSAQAVSIETVGGREPRRTAMVAICLRIGISAIVRYPLLMFDRCLQHIEILSGCHCHAGADGKPVKLPRRTAANLSERSHSTDTKRYATPSGTQCSLDPDGRISGAVESLLVFRHAALGDPSKGSSRMAGDVLPVLP